MGLSIYCSAIYQQAVLFLHQTQMTDLYIINTDHPSESPSFYSDRFQYNSHHSKLVDSSSTVGPGEMMNVKM